MKHATMIIAISLILGGYQVANAASGEEIYNKNICSSCHNIGVGGAPKLGDKTAWAPRVKLGADQLTQMVVRGKGMMPPRGGTTLSDTDLRAVVEYMMGKGK